MVYENKIATFTLKNINSFYDISVEAFEAYGLSENLRKAVVMALQEKFRTPGRVESAMNMFDSSFEHVYTNLAPGVSIVFTFRLLNDGLTLEFETGEIVLRYSGTSYNQSTIRSVIDGILSDYKRYISTGHLND